MSTSVTLNGTTYQIPAEGDFSWGTELSNYFIAISTAVLQKTGGTFTLTSEVNFGATYGVKSAYLKSQAANPASAGIIRLGNAENISWRNQANNADIALTVNASNNLAFGGTKVLISGAIVNADVDAAAAIAYSKLNLSGSIVNADVSNSAAIAVSKLAAVTASRLLVSDASGFLSASSVTSTEAGYLSGVTSAIQTQLNAKAPSASPTFTGTITTPLTASRAVVTGASSELAASATTATEIGYVSGVTSGIQTQLDAKIPLSTVTTKGDLIAATGSGAVSRLAAGTNNHALIADSAQATGLKYANIGVAKNILTCTSGTKTPSASNNYHSLTTNSITLTTGTWELTGYINFSNGGTTPTYTDVGAAYTGSNGADSASFPTTSLSEIANLSIDSAVESPDVLHAYFNTASSFSVQRLQMPTVIVTCTASVTVYIVSYAVMTTAANARVTARMTARQLY